MQTSLPDIVPFRASRWMFNGHAHTIAQSILNYPSKPPAERINIPTEDGDFLELDVLDAGNKQPAVALFHGLEGSTDRYYIIELMQQLNAMDYSVVAVNFRSCGSKLNRNRRFYHSGETEDLSTVFQWMKQRFPDSPVGAAGFSLGGNALLKFLGEGRPNNPVNASVAVSVPYDLKAGSLNIARGMNRIYQKRFLRSLNAKLKKKREIFSDLPIFSGSTLYEFDNQVTGPVHGFNNADHYYESCSSQRFIDSVNRPTLVIHSREDPLCSVDDVPLNEIKQNPAIDYVITDKGGHVGFWGSPQTWLWKTITNFLAYNLSEK